MTWDMRYRFDQIAINSKAKKKPVEEDRHHYIGLEHLDSGSLVVSRWGTDVAPKGEKLLMKKGDVLFGKRRAYQKKVAIAPFDGIFSAHGMVLRPNEEVVDKDFFPMFISSDYFLDTAIGLSVGSLSPTINWRDLARQEFELPSMDKQRELAQVLWAMEETKVGYQHLLADTEELVKSRFIEAIHSLEAEGNVVPLDDLIEDDRPITYGILKPGTGYENGIPVIKVKDIQNGVINQSNLLRTSPEIDSQYKRSKLRAGDLLISIRGTVGRVAEVPDNLNDANITQDTARLTIRHQFNKNYVRAMLESAPLQHDMEKHIRGVAVKGINIGYLRTLKVPMCSREHQDELAAFYEQVDKSKLVIQETLEKHAALKAAIMRTYFN